MLYKLVAVDGIDFFKRENNFRQALENGTIIRHASSEAIREDQHSSFLSVATSPTETPWVGSYPWALFGVEPIGETRTGFPNFHTHAVAVLALRVIEELPPELALGPFGREIIHLFRIVKAIEHIPEIDPALERHLFDEFLSIPNRKATEQNIEELGIVLARAGAMRGIRRTLLYKDCPTTSFIGCQVALALLFKDALKPEQYQPILEVWDRFMDAVKS